MKKITGLIIAIVAVFSFVAVPLASVVGATSPTDSISEGINAVSGGTNKSSGTDLNKGIKNVVDVMLFLLGAIAVIMIIIGGIRYATSNGDASNTKAAKDTILYAVVGLVVAILAYAIVNFVVSSFAAK